jgi:hypothetical protein
LSGEEDSAVAMRQHVAELVLVVAVVLHVILLLVLFVLFDGWEERRDVEGRE